MMNYKEIYYSARKYLEAKRLEKSKNFRVLSDEFRSKIWYSFFLFSLYDLYTKNPKKQGIFLKFDVWEESSIEESKIRHLPFLIKKFFKPKRIYFIDIDKKLIKLAKKNVKFFGFNKAVFVNRSITKMPFKKNFFDFIMDFSTTDHLNSHELKQAIKEIHRVLKKEGLAIIYHMNSDYFNIKKFNYLYKKGLFPSYPRKLKTLISLLEKYEFKIVKWNYCYPFFGDGSLLVYYRFLYNKIYNFLPRKILFSFLNLPKLNLFFYIIIKRI